MPGSADEQVLFPMYTVRLEAVLQMTTLEPHEVLKLNELLVEFETWNGWNGHQSWKIIDDSDDCL